jgi:uncharacterized protein YggE
MRPRYVAAVAGLVAAVVSLPAAASSGEEHTITVTGRGTATTVPDNADWSLGVYTEGRTARRTLSTNSAAMSRVIAALRDAGVSRDELRTEDVLLSPRFDSGGVTGYSASNTVRATLDVDEMAAVIDVGVAAGANRLWGPLLRPAQEQRLYQQALSAAYERARDKARTLAAKAGLALGQARSISESAAAGGYGTPEAQPAATVPAGAPPGSVPPPIEPGQREIRATVVVEFELS